MLTPVSLLEKADMPPERVALLEDAVDRMLESLAQIQVQLESLRVSLSGVISMNDDQECRLREIEKWKYSLAPTFACVAFGLGAVVHAVIARCLSAT